MHPTVTDGGEALSSHDLRSLSIMDEKRFIEELRRASGPMRALILSLTQSSTDLDDIHQEASQALWRKIDDYDPSKPFLAWALTFARMQALAWRKARGREDRKRRAFATEAVEEAMVRKAQDGSGADLANLHQCVSALSERQRALLHRRYHLGYSISEIAAVDDEVSSREALYKTFQRLHQSLLTCLERRRNNDHA